MADTGQRSEQPTPKRLEKARRDGQFPASREFVSSVVFLAFVWLLVANAGSVLGGAERLARGLTAMAFRIELTPREISRLLGLVTDRALISLAIGGMALAAGGVAIHFISTGFGWSWKKAAPDLARLNPMSRLREMPSQNLGAAIKGLILLPVFGWVLYAIAKANLPQFLSLPRTALKSGLLVVAHSIEDLLWKAALVLAVLGMFDLFRQRQRWMNQMKMTKQEVREEQKEMEGNPMVRMRIRRLQRDLLRRRMMQQVPKATAVIVNPTHYAVAIRYQMEAMGAPKVVAKGKNYLAQRIRETAVRNQVPIVENAPLAQALYASAEVGQEIPPHLYQAVAEVLAYIFRLLRTLPGQ